MFEEVKGEIKISDPNEGVKNLWKYFDLHRFIYLITEKELFFTRLDNLDDPFEGVSTSFLRTEAVVNEFWNSFEPKTMEDNDDMGSQKKLLDYFKIEKLHIEKQRLQYANCWFLGERESMAMWNLYSNEDSVAVKINFDKAKKEFSKSFEKLVANNGNRLSVIGEQITYLNINPFDLGTEPQNFTYSAMKKDTSFSHEKEYRFLIYTDNLDNQPQFFQVPIEIGDLELTVIAHPRMTNWKFKNLENLIKLSKIKLKLVKSSTVIK